MEELEAVYYVTSAFDGNEEVASNYIIEQTIDSNANASNEIEDVFIETHDSSNHEEISMPEEAESKISECDANVTNEEDSEQVMMMKDDGRVVIVKKGDGGNMILHTFVDGGVIEDCKKVDDIKNDCIVSDFQTSETEKQSKIGDSSEVYNVDSCSPDEQPSTSESVTTIVHLDKTSSKKRIMAKVVKGVEHKRFIQEDADDGPVVDKLTCKYCLKKFTKSSNKQRHIRVVHKMKKITGNDIKCIECDINFKHVNKLREHLQGQHGLDMSDQILTFPNMSEYNVDSCSPDEQPSTSETVTTVVCLDNTSLKERVMLVKGVEHKSLLQEDADDGPVVDKLTCKYCLKIFSKSGYTRRHLRVVHKMKKITGNDIKCIECDINFRHVNKLREHLQGQHSLDMSDQILSFPNMSAFRKWKCEIERKTLCSYTLRHGSRQTLKGPKLFYMCHRSGKYLPKVRENRQRMLRMGGTCKMGIACTAAIYCQECTNEVQVRYVPHHYGHGKETSFVQLSPAEQAAIQESVSSGVPFEKLLDDIKDSEYKDTFQLHLMKRRDIRWINCAFNAEEYNPGISDAESVENWVKRCCQMEDSPVLFYQQQNIGSDQEEFMLVIMTEFQKHILLSAQRNVVCLDSLYRRKGGRFYLTVLLVMDEFDNAFPGAFCISNKVDKGIIEQFLMSIKESTGNLSFKHFMSDNESFFYESWMSVMEDEPRWLWSIFYIDSKIRTQLKVFKGNVAGRAEVYKTMRTLLECQNENVFTCMFKNFVESLQKDPTAKKLGDFIQNKYGSNTEMWALCYRKEVNLSTNIHLEVMHRTFRYCCREGRKKRLDKFLFVVLKLVKYKMLDRISDMLDSDKLNLAIGAINMCHTSGLEIPGDQMSALSEKIWLINTDSDEEPLYVTKELDKCPEHCSLRCDECDICVHQYSCTCVHSMIDANLCRHIHAVVWKFLTPHFSPASSPSHSMIPIDDDMEVTVNTCTDVYYGSILKKTHEVFRKIKANKCNLNKEALDSIMKRLNECVDICAGKKVEEPPKKVPPLPAVPPNTVYVINPYNKNPAQPYILPNILPSPQPINNSSPVSQYVMLLPNNGRILPKL
ncbi:uncharacterized protein [Parasteatoda tepidariorum]|uniref:uncharacterized protein isoform X1 n=1 Tax=Parasteatoda tepidariorum TaxID=114398 RepID=UPI001C723105|nr:uncharacterized protein LOC107439936 [Parasteatoda tepidariorum]